jgi:hypothetical protein
VKMTTLVIFLLNGLIINLLAIKVKYSTRTLQYTKSQKDDRLSMEK